MRNDLRTIAGKLGVDVEQLAGNAVLLLPENMESASAGEDFCDAGDSLLLAKLLKREKVPCTTAFDLGVRPKVLDRRGADVWLGLLWLFAENGFFPVAVSVLSEWISTKFMQGSQAGDSESPLDEPTKVHVELCVQRKNAMSRIKFEGSARDFIAVLSAQKELGNRGEE